MQKKLLKSFQRCLAGIERTRCRIESSFDSGHLLQRDLEIAYSGLFIRSITAFETLIEELFVALVAGNVTRSTYKVRKQFPGLADFQVNKIRLLLLGDRKYLDWLPFYHTEKRVKSYLKGSTPFDALEKNDKNSLKKMVCIRNSLAHASAHARNAFKINVVADHILPPRERTPCGYLRSRYRSSPNMTRFQYHCSELLRLAAILTR